MGRISIDGGGEHVRLCVKFWITDGLLYYCIAIEPYSYYLKFIIHSILYLPT